MAVAAETATKAGAVTPGDAPMPPTPSVVVRLQERWAPPVIVLVALAEVESANNDKAVGRKGERSRWQITRAVWVSHTSEPFVMATLDPELARRVAEKHLLRLMDTLTRKKLPVTPRNLARLWNPRAPDDYADRVVALCDNLQTAAARLRN